MHQSDRVGNAPPPFADKGVRDLLVAIGNQGEAFARDDLKLAFGAPGRYGAVRPDNSISGVITQATAAGFERMLVVCHLGKLVKLGSGSLDPDPSQSFGRVETLVACALEAGADMLLLRQLLGCVSTDAATAALLEADQLSTTMRVLERRIQATLDANTPPDLRLEWVCFSRLAEAFTLVAQSTTAFGLVREWRHS